MMIVDYWETDNGRIPVLEFMAEQTVNARKKLQWLIDYFEIRGLELQGTSDFLIKLKNRDLYELRVRVQKIWYRVLVVIKGSKAWLVHAFRKSTNKTPLKEIKTALERKSILEINLGLSI